MSNCNCIEKVAEVLRTYKHNSGDATARAVAREMSELADALSPPPAPAAEPRAALAAEKGRALEQAAEPGVEKPAPARTPFDAKAWAENMVPICPPGQGCESVGVLRSHDWPDNGHQWTIFGKWPDYDRRYIAAALTAAHAAGDASGYERGKVEAEAHIEVIDGERKALAKMVSAVVEATRPVHEQLGASAAPDAKEAGR